MRQTLKMLAIISMVFVTALPSGAQVEYGTGGGAESAEPGTGYSVAIEMSPNGEIHLTIRPFGSGTELQPSEQLVTFGDGCLGVQSSATAAENDDLVPLSSGSCGDFQIYIFG